MLVSNYHMSYSIAESVHVIKVRLNDDSPRLIDKATLTFANVANYHFGHSIRESIRESELRRDNDISVLINKAILPSNLYRRESFVERPGCLEQQIDNQIA